MRHSTRLTLSISAVDKSNLHSKDTVASQAKQVQELSTRALKGITIHACNIKVNEDLLRGVIDGR